MGITQGFLVNGLILPGFILTTTHILKLPTLRSSLGFLSFLRVHVLVADGAGGVGGSWRTSDCMCLRWQSSATSWWFLRGLNYICITAALLAKVIHIP